MRGLALFLFLQSARAQFGQNPGFGQQQILGQPQGQAQAFGGPMGGCRLKMTDTTVPPCMRDVFGDDGVVKDGLGQAACQRGDSRTMLAPSMSKAAMESTARAIWSGQAQCQQERNGPPPPLGQGGYGGGQFRGRRQAGFSGFGGRPPPPQGGFGQGGFPPPPPGGGFGGPPGFDGPGGGGRGPGLTCNTYSAPGKGRCLQSRDQGNTTAILSLFSIIPLPSQPGQPRMQIVATNGIPSHCYNRAERMGHTPNYACEHYRTLRVYAEPPTLSQAPRVMYGLNMGPAGISVSGAFLYNHLSGEPQCKTAAVTENFSFDPCDGHADPQCRYHYHKAPVCIDGYDRCDTILGWLLDGYPVYGKCTLYIQGRPVTLTSCYEKRVGTTGCDPSQYSYNSQRRVVGGGCNLDKANGLWFYDDAYDRPSGGRRLFRKGQYAYFFTPEYPFIMPGTTGRQQAMCIIPTTTTAATSQSSQFNQFG